MHKEAELEICHQSSITKESSASQAQVKVDDDNFDESIFPLEQTLPGKLYKLYYEYKL